MERHFGAGYASSVARDHVMSALGGRTAQEALVDTDPKEVWRAVCEHFEVPSSLH